MLYLMNVLALNTLAPTYDHFFSDGGNFNLSLDQVYLITIYLSELILIYFEFLKNLGTQKS